ncbi:carbamoyl-phosphate synthase small subunit [Buchnera aphidicola (Thelaxes californica)]|uniref:Carbamoyl phosphate synthase small chain n=1 Tax=Buchnera aphidicola (Thelaxes californica) TaxID=1315998 RepID=A0A4D6YA64_9GAMM|nr:glutamine-hydrolyzing carbamoyl-phosphate synthase small subunit [Buchnera aphidicola]QCI26667.1 carbamoyl-phosphate synthase small subunit [Buchnera aphidicola (Thelaxes californica)]
MHKKATLVLENGLVFHGKSIGINGSIIGELVFNTAMTGYQEILSDPSYLNQIITFTFPQIGNTGINTEDEESYRIHASGIIIHTLTKKSSNYRSQHSLKTYLIRNNIVGISNIDTRQITRILRKLGSQKGCIFTEETESYYSAYQKIKSFSGLEHKNLTTLVSIKKDYQFSPKKNNDYNKNYTQHLNIAVYDFGIKNNILNILHQKKCISHVFPPESTAEKIINTYKKNKKKLHGIILSNGPGDPRPCINILYEIKKLLSLHIPILGICFGHQLLALANGAVIKKMKSGHHGANHPVKNVITNKVIITSQNHNFTIDINTLPKNIIITHISLFDTTIQGIELVNAPAIGFQGHPESAPGPQDAVYFFDLFIHKIHHLKKQYNDNYN